MGVNKILESFRLGIRLVLLLIQTIIGGLFFILLIVPPLIYECIMKPKKLICKKHKLEMIPQGYPDEMGFQRYICIKCNREN